VCVVPDDVEQALVGVKVVAVRAVRLRFNARANNPDGRLKPAITRPAERQRRVEMAAAEAAEDDPAFAPEPLAPAGLRLRSGKIVEADVIVTATGLNLRLFGGIELIVDGEPVNPADRIGYKAMMLEGVPNMAFAVGYTNASWTLKVDLVSAYVARIVAFMAAGGYRTVTPRRPAGPMRTVPFIEMTSGYFQRARDLLPLQGDRAPWRVQQHYFKDAALYRGPVDTENLEFTRAPAVAGR